MEQFNLDKWLQDKSRKVVTRDGREVRILCIDCGVRESQPILVEITCSRNTKVLEYYNIDGTTQDKNLNLFFADDDELTEFEKELNRIVISFSDAHAYMDETEIHHYSKGLLDLARKELQPEFDKEMDKMLAETDKVVYQKGQQDILKSLPKWKKATENKDFDRHVLLFEAEDRVVLTTEINEDEYYIELDDLKTLPK